MTRELVRDAMLETVAEYGKLAILIDDNEDSPSRIARDLYYADTLPRFWLTARSLECAEHVLAVLADEVGSPSVLTQCPCLVIVDRHLLQHCRNGSERSVRIDGMESRCRDHVQLLTRMSANGGGRLRSLLFHCITTHPLGKADEPNGDGWSPRSPYVMKRIRDELAKHPGVGEGVSSEVFQPLRRFGINAPAATPSGEAQRWKAKTWSRTLRRMAQDLRDQESIEARDVREPTQAPVVLLTGAGVSLQSGPYGPGIPRTNSLLFEAAWRLEVTQHELVRQRGPSLVEGPPGCICHATRRAPLPSAGAPPSLSEFRRAVVQEVRGCESLARYPALLEIFGNESRASEDARSRYDFYTSFRTVMQQFDHGFSYGHWLMAQLPWSCIITTNFDSFHERAATTAARQPEGLGFRGHPPMDLGHAALRRGNPAPLAENVSAQDWKRVWSTCRLFKPYGSLGSPSSLVLNEYQMGKRRDHFRAVFQHAFANATSGWLVVLGHSMLDGALQGALMDALNSRPDLRDQLNVVWVVPEAFDVAIGAQRGLYEDGREAFPDLVRARLCNESSEPHHAGDWRRPVEPGDRGGAYSATAMEFLYDLALEFQDVLKVRVPLSSRAP